MKKIIILCLFVFMISACGSSSDSTFTGGSGGGDNGNATWDTSVSGKVVHSAFLASDKVCYDRNGNKQCDTNEPFALVSSDGTYTILGTASDSAAIPLIAELGGNSAPASLYDVSALAVSGIPAFVFETPSGQRTISSITTIIKSAMDSNPSLSLNDAENQVKTSLGINSNLFDSSSEVLELANKVSAAIESMFSKLAADFNITISKNTILLVMNEIIPQLSSIANGSKTPEQIANDTIGNKNQNTITQEMEELANNMPSVKNAVDAFKNGLQAYNFENRYGGYRFELYDISSSEMKTFINNNDPTALPTTLSENNKHQVAIPSNDGSVTFASGNQSLKMSTVETIKMDGERLKVTPLHGSKEITFSESAVMYKFNAISTPPVIDLNVLRNNQCADTVYTCTNVTINSNIIEVRNVGSFDIEMNNDNTYIVKANDESSKYYPDTVFSAALTTPRGKYLKTTDNFGDVYTFKNIDGITIFKVFKINSQYFLAGVFKELLTNTPFLFNKTAAENIKSQWSN